MSLYNSNRQNESRQTQQSAAARNLPDDYVDHAESVIKPLESNAITTSQIRKILSLITEILSVENLRHEDILLDESYQKLQMARVRIAYDAGRDSKVKAFVEKSELLPFIKNIGKNRAEFIRFSRYMEALVAWHRFYGGKD